MMGSGMMHILSRARALMVVVVLAAGLSVATPKPAHASGMVASWGICALTSAYPALMSTCQSIASSAIAQAIGSVIDTHMQGLVTRIQILTGARLAEAQMNAHQADTLNGTRAQYTADNIPSPTDSSCAATTAIQVAVGGIATEPSTGGGSSGGGERATPRPRVSLRNTPGIRTVSEIECGEGSSSAECQATARNVIVDSLTNEWRSPNDAASKDIARFTQEQTLRPPTGADAEAEQTAREAQGEAAPRMYADVQASTIFGNDTLVGSTPEARAQRFNEAMLYCANLMMPQSAQRVAGDMTADRAIQMAVQRAGDARMGLSVAACADIVGRRQPIEFTADNPTYDWIIGAACSYRRAFTSYNDRDGTLESTLNAPNAGLTKALDAACPAPPTRTADGSLAPVRNVTSSKMYLSRMELLRIISTDMFAVPQFALHMGSSNVAELQRMLIAMESVNSQLNMEMMRMQEQLNMIEAASLAMDLKTR